MKLDFDLASSSVRNGVHDMPPLFELAVLHVLLGHDLRQSLESTQYIGTLNMRRVNLWYPHPPSLSTTPAPEPSSVGDLETLLDE